MSDFSQVGVLNESDARINPATEEKQNASVSPVPFAWDHRDFTYVTVGNGIGQIETIVYKTGGAGGTTVATRTFAYDANDQVIDDTTV